MEAVADHYGIPSIHIGPRSRQNGRPRRTDLHRPHAKDRRRKTRIGDRVIFSPDGVHPYPDTGHELYLKAIVRGMDMMRTTGKPGPHTLSDPLVADHWQAAKMVPLTQATLSPAGESSTPAIAASSAGSPSMPAITSPTGPASRSPSASKARPSASTTSSAPTAARSSSSLTTPKPSSPLRRLLHIPPPCHTHRRRKPPGHHPHRNPHHPPRTARQTRDPRKTKRKIDDPKRYNDTAWYPAHPPHRRNTEITCNDTTPGTSMY